MAGGRSVWVAIPAENTLYWWGEGITQVGAAGDEWKLPIYRAVWQDGGRPLRCPLLLSTVPLFPQAPIFLT